MSEVELTGMDKDGDYFLFSESDDAGFNITQPELNALHAAMGEHVTGEKACADILNDAVDAGFKVAKDKCTGGRHCVLCGGEMGNYRGPICMVCWRIGQEYLMANVFESVFAVPTTRSDTAISPPNAILNSVHNLESRVGLLSGKVQVDEAVRRVLTKRIEAMEDLTGRMSAGRVRLEERVDAIEDRDL